MAAGLFVSRSCAFDSQRFGPNIMKWILHDTKDRHCFETEETKSNPNNGESVILVVCVKKKGSSMQVDFLNFAIFWRECLFDNGPLVCSTNFRKKNCFFLCDFAPGSNHNDTDVHVRWNESGWGMNSAPSRKSTLSTTHSLDAPDQTQRANENSN